MSLRISLCAAVTAAVALVAGGSAFADGTETLGPPSVAIASGTNALAAGIGTQGSSVSGPKALNFSVPSGATVKQVLLYWEGHATGFAVGCEGGPPIDDAITVNGTSVQGTLIGGPTNFFLAEYFAAFRADITSLGVVSAGSNTLTISDMFFRSCFDGYASSDGNDGVGVIVIYESGANSTVVGVRDGLDLAYAGFGSPLNATVPQTFTFAPAASARSATLSTLSGSMSGVDLGGLRGNVLRVTFDVGAPITFVNPWQSNQGAEFDAANLALTVPAGASSMTVQAFSEGGASPASFSWIGASLSIEQLTPPPPPPPPPGGEGCTPGYWKNHDGSKKQGNAWTPTGYSPTQLLSSVFSPAALGTLGSSTLRQALDFEGGSSLLDKKRLLVHHAVAALLNAAHPGVSYPMTTAQIIAAVNAALASGDATAILNLKDQLDTQNNAGCPLGRGA